MSTRINTAALDAKMLAYYDELMNEFFNTHHVHLSSLSGINPTPEDRALMAEAEGYAAMMMGRMGGHHDKHVIFHSDPNYCNGLPRKR